MPSDLLVNNDVETKPFGLTESAAVQISKLLLMEEESEKKFMRVAVEGGGCSGFQYIFKFDTERNNDDLVFEKNGVEVVVDETSLELVTGGRLDYVEELIGSYFQIANPNASSSCGCGTSFSI
ncbi:MAG: iron-sulfur cluster insertion protein ErpA [Rhodospirillaceae bacterium]|nr:iron-sulfur cluster insertion protein ErpA [Rhodospirillaceae bacterium]MBT6305083.1 iron-sulfur cluster insertion protein ErpA [Rhodospirillaceae bacterium]MDC1442184.1 iron-sulfur cluster insertion protein ErpA [Rhodospirillaceae bacterium]